MSVITEILSMVQEILEYFKEAEAAGVIEIVKNSLASILEFLAM